MNIMRFRERLKQLRDNRIILPGAYEQFNSAPVFMCGPMYPLNELEVEFAKQEILDEHGKAFKRTPYPVFSLTSIPEEEGLENVVVNVWNKPSRSQFYDESGKLSECDMQMTLFFSAQCDNQDIALICRYKSGAQNENACAVSLFKDFKYFEPTGSGKEKSMISALANDTRGTALRLLVDLMNTSNAVVKVSPDREGKSVEWVQSRTHYCIINKSQAQKCQLGKRGPTDHELVRAAHWRRAHLRRLMSDKFKHKKGQLVFIKQSWVGPTEWIGTDKKIYKVVNIQQP